MTLDCKFILFTLNNMDIISVKMKRKKRGQIRMMIMAIYGMNQFFTLFWRQKHLSKLAHLALSGNILLNLPAFFLLD